MLRECCEISKVDAATFLIFAVLHPAFHIGYKWIYMDRNDYLLFYIFLASFARTIRFHILNNLAGGPGGRRSSGSCGAVLTHD